MVSGFTGTWVARTNVSAILRYAKVAYTFGRENGWVTSTLIACTTMSAVFVKITATAFRLLDTQVPAGEDCRGLQVRISKTKGGARGRYKVEVLPRRVDPNTLPLEKNPIDTLAFLWRAKNQHSDRQ